MRQLIVLLISLSLLHGVRANPFEKRQNLLDPLESFVSSLVDPGATPTPTGPGDDGDPTSAPTHTPHHHSKGDPDDDATTIPEPAVQTSTTQSSSSEPTSSSSSSSSSTTSTTSSPSTLPPPTNPANAAQATPESSQKNSGSSITPAGIAVAVIMSIAVLVAIFVVVWKYYGPVRRWREKKEYERMQERTYRPALDGPFPQSASNEKGLGLSNLEQRLSRPLSFFALAAPKHQIKRKPVPTPGQAQNLGGVSAGSSPVLKDLGTGTPRMEKGLPSIPQ